MARVEAGKGNGITCYGRKESILAGSTDRGSNALACRADCVSRARRRTQSLAHCRAGNGYKAPRFLSGGEGGTTACGGEGKARMRKLLPRVRRVPSRLNRNCGTRTRKQADGKQTGTMVDRLTVFGAAGRGETRVLSGFEVAHATFIPSDSTKCTARWDGCALLPIVTSITS